MYFDFKGHRQNWIFNQREGFLQATESFPEEERLPIQESRRNRKMKISLSLRNRYRAKLRHISATLIFFCYYKNKEKQKREH